MLLSRSIVVPASIPEPEKAQETIVITDACLGTTGTIINTGNSDNGIVTHEQAGTSVRPSAGRIIRAVAMRFNVSAAEAIDWLSEIDYAAERQALKEA